MSTIIPYLPSAFFYRQALRSARTRQKAVDLAVKFALELGQQRSWAFGEGLVPPEVPELDGPWIPVILQGTKTKAEAVELGLAIILAIERQRDWVRAQDLMPPKFLVMPTERAARARVESVCRSSTSEGSVRSAG